VVNNNSDRSTNPFSKLFEVFNPNARKSKLTEFPDNPEALTKRVCNIALPAIHMYQPLSGYVSAATTLCEFSAVMLKTGKDIYSLNGMALLQDGKDWMATLNFIWMKKAFNNLTIISKICRMKLATI